MPGKTKKGGGLESYSPYKMKGHALPGINQDKNSPLKDFGITAAIAASVIGALAGAGASAALRPKGKVGQPGLTAPDTGGAKIGTGQQEVKKPRLSDEM